MKKRRKHASVRERARAIYAEMKQAPGPYRMRSKFKVRVDPDPRMGMARVQALAEFCWGKATIVLKPGATAEVIAHELAHLYTEGLEQAAIRQVRCSSAANRRATIRWAELIADLISHLWLKSR